MTTRPQVSGFNGKQFAIWMCALVLGGVLGALRVEWLNEFFNFVAAIYTRLFQFVAVPTIALAITVTLATLGAKQNTGRIFLHTITYTLLTTFASAIVGVLLYKLIAPGNLPPTSSRKAPPKSRRTWRASPTTTTSSPWFRTTSWRPSPPATC